MTTTDVLGRLKTSDGGLHFLFGNGFTDGTETELKVYDLAGNSVSVGDHLHGKTLQELGLQLTDGSILTTAILYGADGGIVASWRGCERITGNSFFYNMEAKKLAIPLVKGMVLKVNTAD
jgi:hypothetical protein